MQIPAAKTTIARWGNSEAIRIPKQLLDMAELRRGDEVVIEFVSSGHLGVRRAAPTEHRHVMPSERLTFDELFRGYTGSRLDNGDTWADADEHATPAEQRTWSR